MSISELNQQKVLLSKIFLLEIIETPSDFKDNDELFTSLKSQGGLAKLEVPTRNIYSCSLNTLKSASELLLNRGFLEIDELRKNAQKKLGKARLGETKNKRTRAGLEQSIVDLNNDVQILKKSSFLLQTIISDLQEGLKQLSLMECKIERVEHYQEINKEMEAKLSFIDYGEL